MADFLNMSEAFQGAVTVGERGQVVITASTRELCGIAPGDKLLVFVAPGCCGATFVRLDKVQEIAHVMATLAGATVPVDVPEASE